MIDFVLNLFVKSLLMADFCEILSVELICDACNSRFYAIFRNIIPDFTPFLGIVWKIDVYLYL